MKEEITLFRRGFFVTKNFTDTQCTTKGHEAYTYEATLKCGYKLDGLGFIVDHTLIHKAIVKYIEDKPMLSCEVMSKEIAHLIVDFTKVHGCDLKGLKFTIIPVQKGQLQKGEEGNWIAKNPLKINYLMPANAIYKVVVNESYQSILTDEDRKKFIDEVSVSSELVSVTRANGFVGMRVMKGKDWRSVNDRIMEGEHGTLKHVPNRFPDDINDDTVKVNWDSSTDVDELYYIRDNDSELYVVPNSITKEEYEEAKTTPVTKKNAVLGLRVIKGEHWSSGNDEIEDGEVGTIVKSKTNFPINVEDNYVRVNWDETGFSADTYRIIEGREELAVEEVKYEGSIVNFPKQVVEKMLERQVEQGNARDVSVFERSSSAGKSIGGFTWDETEEGDDFWVEVISNKEFYVFFAKYPKQ